MARKQTLSFSGSVSFEKVNISISTHLKLWIASARHNFKWVKISTVSTIPSINVWRHVWDHVLRNNLWSQFEISRLDKCHLWHDLSLMARQKAWLIIMHIIIPRNNGAMIREWSLVEDLQRNIMFPPYQYWDIVSMLCPWAKHFTPMLHLNQGWMGTW